MASVECLREFVNERLNAAAEEIFRVFTKTVVKYEEEINRQRRLLDICWRPDIKLHRIELPQQHDYTREEVLTDQQLCNQERSSSLDQEEPEPPQIKEEPEEVCTSQEEEQLVLKQETDTFMLTPTHGDNDHSGDETQCFNPDKNQSAAETQFPDSMSINWQRNEHDHEESNRDNQPLSHKSHEAESQDQSRGEHEDSGSIKNAEPELKKSHHKSKSHSSNEGNIHLNSGPDKTYPTCGTCGKEFKDKSRLSRHLRIHTGERPYICNTCGNSFGDVTILRRHIMIHTGVRPYSCKMCGKDFRLKSDLKVHLRTHTGEKPYNCTTCGKSYSRKTGLKWHMRIHANELVCSQNSRELCGDLTVHLRRAHTHDKSFNC